MKKKVILVFLVIGIILLGGSYFVIKYLNKNNNTETNQNLNENSFDFENTNELDNEVNNQENIDKENNNNSNEDIKKEENDSKSKFELKKLGNLQYYLYTPSNPTNGMPLIMYLHGGTAKRSNEVSAVIESGFPKYLKDGYYGNLRAYVVIPKLDNSYNGWSDISDTLRNLIKNTNTNYGIDMKKVSLTGHSLGGTGTYQVQVKLPNTFSCIAPMSGSIENTEENVAALSKTKIWAFVGTNDTIVNPKSSQTIIEALKNKGASARITEFNEATHFDVPELGYKNKELINWLIINSK